MDQTLTKPRYCSKETVKQKKIQLGKNSERNIKRGNKGQKYGSVNKGGAKVAKGNLNINVKKRGSSLKEFLNRVGKEDKGNIIGGGSNNMRRREMLKNVISPKRKKKEDKFFQKNFEFYAKAVIKTSSNKNEVEEGGKRNLKKDKKFEKLFNNQLDFNFKSNTFEKLQLKNTDPGQLSSRNERLNQQKMYLRHKNSVMAEKKKFKKGTFPGSNYLVQKPYHSKKREDRVKGFKSGINSVQGWQKSNRDSRENLKSRPFASNSQKVLNTNKLMRGSFNFSKIQNQEKNPSYKAGLRSKFYNSVKSIKQDFPVQNQKNDNNEEIKKWGKNKGNGDKSRHGSQLNMSNKRRRVSSFKANKRRGNSRSKAVVGEENINIGAHCAGAGYQMKTLNDFLSSNVNNNNNKK